MLLLSKFNLIRLIETNCSSINHIRHYARWVHRRPRKILTAEEYNETEKRFQKTPNNETSVNCSEEQIIELNPDELKHSTNIERKQNKKWIPKTAQAQLGEDLLAEINKKSDIVEFKVKTKKKRVSYITASDANATTDMLETVIDAKGDYIYTKLKDNDVNISQLMITVKSRKEQIKNNLILLEGKRLIKDALNAQCKLKNLIFSRKSDVEFLKPYLPKTGAKLYKIPYKEIQMWSDLTTTPGIMGIFKTPEVEKFSPPEGSLPLSIICDNVREPGNLGAILRIAAAVGAQNVLLTKGCVDLWDTKVLRSACGAHFRLQIHKKMEWPNIRNLFNNLKITTLIADNNVTTENMEHPEEKLDTDGDKPETKTLEDVISKIPVWCYYGLNIEASSHIVLIVGGETEGISDYSYYFASDFGGVRLNIPMNNDIESLNTGTALGIIAFEIKRQFMHSTHIKNMENQ